MSETDEARGRAGSGIPRQLDALLFSRSGGRQSGVVDVSALERVAQESSNGRGQIEWSIAGSVDGEGACWLVLEVSGSLDMQCQRCLDDVAIEVSSQSRFRLIPEGEPWNDEDLDDDSFEALEIEGPLDTQVLVEDEVLLSLPVIALHEDCEKPGSAADERAGADSGKPSPFAVLGKLKKI